MSTLKSLLLFSIPILLICGVGGYFIGQIVSTPNLTNVISQTTTTAQDESEITTGGEVTITPTPAPPVVIENKTFEVHSPDGKKNLILERETKSNGEATYSFFVADIPEVDRKLILTQVFGPTQTMVVPDNSWSPDNKYFFLEENNEGRLSYLVFDAEGEAFPDGSEFINVMPVFAAKITEYAISKITGWDAPALLHVKTIGANSAKGPTFWYEVPSGAVIRLASR